MKRRASEWSSIYLLVVVAITAVLLVTFVKPMFKQAQETSDDAADSAGSIARGALFGASVFLMPRKNKDKTKHGELQKVKPTRLTETDLFPDFGK